MKTMKFFLQISLGAALFFYHKEKREDTKNPKLDADGASLGVLGTFSFLY